MKRETFWQRKGLVIPLLWVALAFSGCMRSPEAKSAAYLESGKKLLQKNDAKRALLEFRNAARVTPKNPEVYYQLGLAYLASGDLRSGVAGLRKALALNPKLREAQLRLAELMTGVNDKEMLKDAQQRLQELLTDAPENAEALHALALTELKLGEPEAGLEHLEKAFGAMPTELIFAVNLAEAKLQRKDFKGAEEVLKKACESAPKSADPVVVLGWLYLSQNRASEAEQQFRRALAMDPDHATAISNLATLQYKLGRKQEAEQDFKRLSLLPSKTLKPLYAIFLFQEGRHDEAIREFERLAKQDPEDRLARTRLIQAYRSANRAQDAERVLDRALKKNAKDMDALLQRSEMLVLEGKYGPAETDLNQVLHLQPNSGEAYYALAKLHQARGSDLTYRQNLSKALELNPNLLSVRLELAQALLAAKKAQGALDVLNRAPQSQKELTSVLMQRNWILWSLGNLADMRKGIDQGLAHERSVDLLIQDGLWKLKSKDPAAARKAIEEALKTDPSDVRALLTLSQTYIAQKNAPMALQKAREYAARQPRSAAVQDFLGLMLMSQGFATEARAAFAAAKAADPKYVTADLSLAQLDVVQGNMTVAKKRLETIVSNGMVNPTAQLWLGIVEEKTGDRSAAIEQYRKVAEADPGNAQALNNLAYLLSEVANRPDEALKYAQEAVQLFPERPAYCDTLGWILYRKGLYSAAVPYLERAGSNNTHRDNVVWKYHLAMAYSKTGNAVRGRATLEAAEKLNPNLPEANIARETVGATR